VTRQNNTVTPAGVAAQRVRCCRANACGATNVIWSRQRRWRDQKGQIYKNFLRAIIIEILNKKGLKTKKNLKWGGAIICIVDGLLNNT